MTQRTLHSGWYVSEGEYIEKRHKATIYFYESRDKQWSVANTDRVVEEKDLPLPPRDMWALHLMQR